MPIDLTEMMPDEVLDGRNLEDDGMKEQLKEQLKQMAHTHYVKFPLTTTEERNTFLHGTTFVGQTEEPLNW
ncbi:hypothetical protein [Pseudomonas syringae]|uniref:hypothetical protein n=1 Tax=Pseudomonas syringae TaxID=317 RepID=UPI001FD20BE8|nr:hypothetical protein [Pseudomonas syringae]